MAEQKKAATPPTKTTKPATQPATQRGDDAAQEAVQEAKRKTGAVVDSLSTNAELAVHAGRPYMDRRDVDRPRTGWDPTSPGSDREHPPYSDTTVEDRTEVSVETLAFPALAGHPGVEVATRTPDRREDETGVFRKRYVVLKAAYQPGTDNIHARNQLEVLQTAINLGLHPQEEAKFDGDQDHPDGVSIYLDYSVPVVPAIIDGDAPSAVTPHHVLRDHYDLSTESKDASDAVGAEHTE